MNLQILKAFEKRETDVRTGRKGVPLINKKKKKAQRQKTAVQNCRGFVKEPISEFILDGWI